MAVFVVLSFSANLAVHQINRSSSPYISSSQINAGGPELTDSSQNDFTDMASPTGAVTNDNSPFVNAFLADSATIYGMSHPFSTVIPEQNGVFKYKVKEGDTISGIAYRFGITVNTVLWANPEARSLISPGQELTILPVPGIIYETKEDDTLESVAEKHNIDTNLIKQYNTNHESLFDNTGSVVILPHARPLNTRSPVLPRSMPALSGYFGFPTDPENSWNWGRLHAHNAIDIATHCGDPIYASAEGIVTEEKSGNNMWNGGYGYFLTIEHPNGTKTKYAHNDKNLVAEGEYVMQGDLIALVGNTGNVHGPTGCHVHFEVHGAQNPFAVR